jgi:hypothetical protein
VVSPDLKKVACLGENAVHVLTGLKE